MVHLVPSVLLFLLSLGLKSLPPAPNLGTGAAHDPGPIMDTHSGEPDYTSVIERLRRNLPALMAGNQVPGVAVALVDDQTVVWSGGFGFTDRSGKQRITADTRFSLQSVTKTYTATAFMKAVHQGRFTLDQPLKGAVPGFGVRCRWGETEADRITFRHLLCHQAGLCHEAPIGNNLGEWHCGFDEHVRSISDTWLKCRVGERFRYSNLGFDLAGYALQLRAGKPFPRLMQEELFEPLGMTASTCDQARALGDAAVPGAMSRDGRCPRWRYPCSRRAECTRPRTTWRGSSAFHLAGGIVGDRRLIGSETLRAMYTPQFPRPGQEAGYGLGVNSRPYHGATLLFHGGGGYGYSTDQRWVPEYKFGVVTLSNGDGGDDFVADLADKALSDMIRAKLGSLTAGSAPPLDAGADHHALARSAPAVGGELRGREPVDRLSRRR